MLHNNNNNNDNNNNNINKFCFGSMNLQRFLCLREKINLVINYIYMINTAQKKLKELLELELTSCNKKVTLRWDSRVKGLVKIALKYVKNKTKCSRIAGINQPIE